MFAVLRRTFLIAFVLIVSIAVAFAFALAAGAILYWIVRPILIDRDATGTVVVFLSTLVAVSTVRYVGIWLLAAIGLLVPARRTGEESGRIKLLCYANVAGVLLALIPCVFLSHGEHLLLKCEVCLICILWAWFFARDFANKASSLDWARLSQDSNAGQHEYGR
jgi:hypothetical protein